MRGASAGKTMYVVPYLMAPPGSPLSAFAAGVELTDDRTVVLHMIRMARVGAEHLYAALSAYLLIGVCWGVLYVAVVRLAPGALLLGGEPLRHGLGMGDAIYFSFVTLATLGYGDFTPAIPVMRGLSVFEAIIGQLYLAIMVARLVSLRVAGLSPH